MLRDLVIAGKVGGTIELPQHVLTVGPTGRVKAQLSAKSVVVLGKVNGSIQASGCVSARPARSKVRSRLQGWLWPSGRACRPAWTCRPLGWDKRAYVRYCSIPITSALGLPW